MTFSKDIAAQRQRLLDDWAALAAKLTSIDLAPLPENVIDAILQYRCADNALPLYKEAPFAVAYLKSAAREILLSEARQEANGRTTNIKTDLFLASDNLASPQAIQVYAELKHDIQLMHKTLLGPIEDMNPDSDIGHFVKARGRGRLHTDGSGDSGLNHFAYLMRASDQIPTLGISGNKVLSASPEEADLMLQAMDNKGDHKTAMQLLQDAKIAEPMRPFSVSLIVIDAFGDSPTHTQQIKEAAPPALRDHIRNGATLHAAAHPPEGGVHDCFIRICFEAKGLRLRLG